jgi:ribulose-phosphate 3-epimerase
MTTEPTGFSFEPDLPLNTELIWRLQRSVEGVGVELSGSIYAVPPAQRPAVAQLLAEQMIWVHADVFADARTGVSLDLIGELADGGVGPVDVHLLTAGALEALDVVCRPGVAQVTFPFEGVPDDPAVAARIRAAGARPWLAIAPGTTLEACADALPHVDGLLVMLLEPGTSGRSDPAILAKVSRASAAMPVGVDGGVGEDNLGDVLAAGATYVVVGRRLFPVTTTSTKEEQV